MKKINHQNCDDSCPEKLTDAQLKSLQAAQRRYNDMCNSGETYTEVEWLALSTHLTAVAAYVTGDKVNFLMDRAKDCQSRARNEQLIEQRNVKARAAVEGEFWNPIGD